MGQMSHVWLVCSPDSAGGPDPVYIEGHSLVLIRLCRGHMPALHWLHSVRGSPGPIYLNVPVQPQSGHRRGPRPKLTMDVGGGTGLALIEPCRRVFPRPNVAVQGLLLWQQGRGSSINCHCSPTSILPDLWGALQIRYHGSIGQIWHVGQS